MSTAAALLAPPALMGSTCCSPPVAPQANDGGVVYLNGNELLRWNVPTGALAYNTLATALGEKVKWMQYTEVRSPPPHAPYPPISFLQRVRQRRS